MGKKVTNWVFGLGGAALLGLARLSLAGPLDTAVVDKDATWMFHLDVEAGMASTCGRFAEEGWTSDPESKEVIAKFGIDPVKDVKGLTVYGFKPGEDDGVAVLVTTAAVDGLKAKLEAEKMDGFAAQVQGDLTRLSWKSDGREWHLAIKPRNAERVVVLASTSDVLEAGLTVVNGGRASLKTVDATAVAPMLQKPAKGSILFVTARGLADCPKFKTSFFKEARSLVIDVGEETAEKGKETFAKVSVETADEKMATSMQQMVQGLIAMGSIMARDKEYQGVPESLQGIKVAAEGSSLVISAREDSDELLKQLKALGAAIKASDGHMDISINSPKPSGEKKAEQPAKKDTEK